MIDAYTTLCAWSSKLITTGLLFLCFGLSHRVCASDNPYVDFGQRLNAGRDIWLGTCESCHGYGIAGAPIPMQPIQWKDRVKKQTDELYNNAINGFFGPGDTYMPPRGGNQQLSDAEIKQAVNYMIALAKYYIEKEEKKR